MLNLVILFWVGVVLTLIILFGHFVWVVVAWFIRLITGSAHRQRLRITRRCGWCNHPTLMTRARCDWCGRDLHSAAAEEAGDLAAATRQVVWLKQAGRLDANLADSLLATMADRRAQITGQPASAEPKPVPREKATQVPLEAIILDAERPKPALRPALPPAPIEPAAISPPVPKPVPAQTGRAPRDIQPQRPIQPQAPAAARTAPVQKPSTPKPVSKPKPKPKPPRKSLGRVLAAFLEERNIQTAELLGVLTSGMLMVGGSVMLVIYFWETLQALPMMKFAVFAGYSAAVFLAGLFAQHRWKLEHTGRGLLTIAVLLVPLNFVAMAGRGNDLLVVAVEFAALGLFSYLVYVTAKVLMPKRPGDQILAVMGASAAVLLFSAIPAISGSGWSAAVAGFAVAAILATAVGRHLRSVMRDRHISGQQAADLFMLLGTGGFAAIWPLGVLIRQATAAGHELAAALDPLAIAVGLLGATILTAGAATIRGLDGNRPLAIWRTVATALALVGMGVMLLALVLAWPYVLAVAAVGMLSMAVLAAVGLRFGFPPAHAGAIGCATLAYLAGFQLVTGQLPAWGPAESIAVAVRQFLDASSGAALVGLVGLLGVISWYLERLHRRADALVYAFGAAAVAAASVLMVGYTGWLTDPTSAAMATAVFALYSVGALLLNVRLRREELSYGGYVLAVAATVWGLRAWTDSFGLAWAAVLAAEAVVMAAVAAALSYRQMGYPSCLSTEMKYQSRRSADGEQRPEGPAVAMTVFRRPLLDTVDVLLAAVCVIAAVVLLPDPGGVANSAVPPVMFACLGAAYLLQAGARGRAVQTWVASIIGLVGVIHAQVWVFPDLQNQPWIAAMLSHATAAMVAGAVCDVWARRRGKTPVGDAIRLIFVRPLGRSAVLSSALVVPLFFIVPWQNLVFLSVCLFWLAGVWLVIAWTERSAGLVTAAQAAMAAATVVACSVWLQENGWGSAGKIDLNDPRDWQVYGVGLALLSLVWAGIRVGSRYQATVARLLEPGWAGLDRVLRGFLVAAQGLVLLSCLVPGCVVELDGRAGAAVPGWVLVAFGPTAWILLGLLAVVLIVALWDRWQTMEVAAAVLVAASAPWLLAGQFGLHQDTASLLRWVSAGAFLICSAAVWQRQRLAVIGHKLRMQRFSPSGGAVVARAATLATMAAPVVVLSLAAAAWRIGGVAPGGPATASFLAALGPVLSYLVPLVVVIGAMVGYALAERSAGYAFSAGLVAKMTVVLGYLLVADRFGVVQLVTALQLLAITSAVWAVAWIGLRRYVDVWREDARNRLPSTLMNAQLGIGLGAGMLVLVPGLLGFLASSSVAPPWTLAAGSWIGWVALLSIAAAEVIRRVESRQRVRPELAGLAGLAGIGLVACSVAAVPALGFPWGYHTLMLGWAMYGVLVAAATWWLAGQVTVSGAQGPPQALVRAANIWVTTAGVLALLLGLKAAIFHSAGEEQLWSAAAIALASVSAAVMAVWRRLEAWAFIAGLGVNLAASMVVGYFEPRLAAAETLVLLIEANIIAAAAVALAWLAARRRLYQLREISLRSGPLLALQLTLATAACAALVVPAAVALIAEPGRTDNWIGQLGQAPGWVAVLLTTLAVAWYLRQIAPGGLANVIGAAAVSVPVLAACRVSVAEGLMARDAWIGYHVLTGGWAVTSLVLVILGWGAGRQKVSLKNWAGVAGCLAVALGVIWCLDDPLGPWCSAGSILVVALAAALVAVWQDQPRHAVVAALLLNLAGTVGWITLGNWTLPELIAVNVTCLAAGSIVWAAVGRLRPAAISPVLFDDGDECLPHVAALVGLTLLGAVTATAVAFDLFGVYDVVLGMPGWIALTATAVALLVSLTVGRPTFVPAALYYAGLTAVGLGLHERGLHGAEMLWHAVPELAAFVLAAAVLRLGLPRIEPLVRRIQAAESFGQFNTAGFAAVQATITGIAGGLGLWIAASPTLDAYRHALLPGGWGRLAGPAAMLLLLGGALAMVRHGSQATRDAWRSAAIWLAMLAAATIGWALLPAADAHLLNRTVLLMVAGVAAVLACGLALGRLRDTDSRWASAVLSTMPWLTGMVALALAVVLAEEVWLFNPATGAPTAVWAVVVVSAAIAALAIAALVLAMVPKRDPLKLSDRGRTVYVYAAEVFCGLTALHLWLAEPQLFRLGIIEHYWMLLVMGGAFLGAGLSELFQRRGMPILAEPLGNTAALLPLVPAIAFWIPVEAVPSGGLVGSTPAIWFLAGLFYSTMAVTRRSQVYGGLGLGTFCIGFWVLWHQLDLGIWEHPQLWLIPVGLSLLVAEYLNHRHLSKPQAAGIRYFALSLIYVSSSTEFLRDIGQGFALPLVLIGFSLAGIMAGVFLRVRSFVATGFTFLVMVIVALIFHAGMTQQHRWVLYVSIIILGAGVIACIAVFEKKRPEILAAMERFRTWERRLPTDGDDR